MAKVTIWYKSVMNKTEFTKRCIADALFELMKVKDISDISVKEIVNKAGFSRMSYYRNFKSYEEALHYFLDMKTSDFQKKKGFNYEFNNALDAIDRFAIILADEDRREIDDVFVRQNLQHIIFDNTHRFIVKTSPKDRLFVDLFIAGGLNEIWYTWVKRGHKESVEEIISYLKSQVISDAKKILIELNEKQE